MTSNPTIRSIQTASGRISYAEAGSGSVVLFVHGVLMNKHFWRHQVSGLSDIRRCLAVDLLAHGDTVIKPDQDASVTANAQMPEEVLDALRIDKVDLVGNDSGGGIAQIFAALHPSRVRTLTLTNCDTHDSWPPEAFKSFLATAAAGGLTEMLNAMIADKAIYRSPGALGLAYERSEDLSDADIDVYLQPLVRSTQRIHDLQRFLAAVDNNHTVSIEAQLRQLHAPTFGRLGNRRHIFPSRMGGLADEAIPGARPPVELAGARIFFAEERAARFNPLLREHVLAE